mgnify:CR=1 FL=1
MRMDELAQITCVRIRDMVNSRDRVHASLQLDQSRAREFSDMAKSRMCTREFAQTTRMRIRDMVNSRVCTRASLPLLAKIARAKFAT